MSHRKESKAGILVRGLIRNLTPDRKYFNLMKYPEYIESLPIWEDAILLESQQGRDFEGNIYHVFRELAANPAFDGYRIYLVGRGRDTIHRIEERVKRLGLEGRCEILKMWSTDYFKAAACSKYLINDNTFPSFFIKRDEQVYINLWHGTPLKTLGRRDRNGAHAIGNAQKNFMMADYLLYPNEYTRDHMIEDYMIENISNARTMLLGYPRNAALIQGRERERIRSELGLGAERIYAYMPTWRSDSDSELMDSILLNLDDRLRENEIMYVKLHPVAKEQLGRQSLRRIRLLPDEYELYDFLSATDGLVTDYSSVMFDYALTGNPVSLYTFDLDTYEEERGLYMSVDELPWKHSDSIDEVLEALRDNSSIAGSDWLDRFCAYDSEDVTERLLRQTILGEDMGIEESAVSSNGKPNVLIYCGNLSRNGVTTALKSLISAIDLNEKNYFLTFSASAVAPNRNVLSELPSEVKYISVVGKMNATKEEKKALISYAYRWDSAGPLMDAAEPLFKRNIRRVFYKADFETVIQFSGYSYKRIIEFSMFDAKRIIYVHNDMLKEIETRGNQRLEILEYAYDKYDVIAAVSESVKAATERLILTSACPDVNVRKIRVAENIIDTERIRRLAKLPVEFTPYTRSNMEESEISSILESDSPVFVNIARYSKEKGHERLLDAFNKYWKKHRGAYLIIIGGNQMSNMYEYLISEKLPSLQCRNNVALILRMDNPFSILSRSDGFIFSSFYEGFGLVVAEADILGVPVVSTDIDGPRLFMKDNGGTLVENSEKGILEGLELLGEGRVEVMNADYEALNKRNLQSFYDMLQKQS